mgnify:CR=1 FL=1
MNDLSSMILPGQSRHNPLILPRQSDRDIMPDLNDDNVDDMEEPCPVEDEAVAKQCPICCHSSGDGGWISKLNELEDSLTGTISPEEIYRTQFQLFEKIVKEPLSLQGKEYPDLSVDDLREHYSKHRMNIAQIVSKEILFCNEMQRQLRSKQIAVVNVKTGSKRLLMAGIREWQRLSKHKLDLIKYYNGPLAKRQKTTSSVGIKPYEFG